MQSHRFVITAILVILLLCGYKLAAFTSNGNVSIAITGSFYKYNYVLTPGTTINSSDVYVIVFNLGSKPTIVELGYSAPKFIVLNFSEKVFTLNPGSSKKVFISITALDYAKPGVYSVNVYASVVMKTIEGKVVLVPAAGQKANVTIVSPTGTIIAETVDDEGRRVPATILLVRVSRTGNYTYEKSINGSLSVSVPPGTYIVKALMGNELLAEKKLVLKANETKHVVLVVKTVWFETFGVLPYYKNETIVFAKIIAVVKNVYKPIENVTINLVVYKNGKLIDNITIVRIPLLPEGRSEYQYRYVPPGGWTNGTYAFSLALYSPGKLYTKTSLKYLNVTIYTAKQAEYRTVTKTELSTTSLTTVIEKPVMPLHLLIILVIVLIVLVLVYLLAKLKKKYKRKGV